MNILVLNGSPKGDQSITIQHIKFLEFKHPDHPLKIINIGSNIRKIEKKPAFFEKILSDLKLCDAVIWSFPVYYALVPSQLKRFIELLYEKMPPGAYKGKFATSFTTSIHFFDHTAHNYMQAISEDLGFTYINSFSAHMNDFFHEDERSKMDSFYQWFFQMVSQKVMVPPKYQALNINPVEFTPPPMNSKPKTIPARILLLTDAGEQDINLVRMTDVFRHASSMAVDIRNIHDVGIKNGCLGCCTCGYDNTCIQKDDFSQFYNSTLKTADIIIMAGTIKDHYLSSGWKQFLDRSFFNGHSPVLQGKRLGFIISGPLRQIQNLRECLGAVADNWHMKSFQVVTDEGGTSEQITRDIQSFAKELELGYEKNLEMSPTFYRVAGMKLFRDFIYATSAVFRADHIFYKKHGIYKDFPQRQLQKRIQNTLFSFFISIKPLRKMIYQKFIPGMVAPYKKTLKQLERHKMDTK